MFIKYENLTIRNAVVSDAEQLCAWWNDPKIMAQFCFPNGVGCKPEEIRQGIIDDADDNRHIIHSLLFAFFKMIISRIWLKSRTLNI